ncbi:putative serine/threonine-protein kinase [Brachypodium distachyon]|uniref:non-specific serine/threonine protein kinase n=1 Tax=Brachypodium distachyon TaxID=15368 RepID=A0A0Q3JXN8_BRADI|nr:putative serine/threonine-protein kinase [Brachypodium distachyon]KQK03241.1 hypothetical protein BRADI_2g06510v3 [Brachypodium distachyon]|eukprot:XP_003565479.1 putative serine/threonine-protein kinase [Brachypodium distachyon]
MPACCCFRGRANPSKKHLSYSPSVPASSSEPETKKKKKFKVFTYRELRWATNNFHRSNKIGQGGFGAVYKGTLRDGSDVAVKVLSASSRQGIKEFLTEIHVIADVDHPNLVDLLGCCAHGDRHRILVYDLLPNGSLHRALLSSTAANGSSRRLPAAMTWRVRRGACVGVARGLAFLHEELGVVHRDIKASNVLLDADWAPKIGDFGLARLFPDNVTHVSTRVAGTTGYLAPEYAWHGQLTKKADVYSFGVLVLEIVTGKSSSRSLHHNCLYNDDDEKVLVERVWETFETGKLGDIIDPALVFLPETKEKEEAVRYMKVALLCTQAAPLRRPAMPQVVEMLERGDVRIRETEMTPPGYVVKSHHRQDGSDKKHSSVSSMLVNVSHSTVTEIAPR